MTQLNKDFEAIESRQQGAWAAGNYAVVGTTLQIVSEALCETLDLRAGMRVLDVAAGNGNATLAAARRFAEVTSTDHVPALLESGRRRAEAEGLAIRFHTADAENLPFADGAFDAVLSTFGVMFTPDQQRAASELLRVCRPGGKIGLAVRSPGTGPQAAVALGHRGPDRRDLRRRDGGAGHQAQLRLPVPLRGPPERIPRGRGPVELLAGRGCHP